MSKTLQAGVVHGANRLLTAILCVVIACLAPPAVRSLQDFVGDAQVSLVTNSPFKTASSYYHPDDTVDFIITRAANFDAVFMGSRILRRMLPDLGLEESALRETVPPGAIDRGTHHYLAHVHLPKTIVRDGQNVPLPPGRYYYEFPLQYTVYNHVHAVKHKTTQFMVVDASVAIDQRLPALRQIADDSGNAPTVLSISPGAASLAPVAQDTPVADPPRQ